MPGTLHKYELVLLFWEKPIFLDLHLSEICYLSGILMVLLHPILSSMLLLMPPGGMYLLWLNLDGTYNNGTYFLSSKILEDGFSFSAMGGKFHHMYLM